MRVRDPVTGRNVLISDMTYQEWAGWKQKVKQVGGKHYKLTDADNKKDVAAAKEYRKISKNTADVEAVASYTGFSKADIHKIKRHIFFEKHKKIDSYELLDPDYDIAVAWKRLSSGKFESRGITLLRHELLEANVEKEY